MKFEAFILTYLTARNQVEAFWNPFSFYKPAWSQAAQPTYDYFSPRPIYQDPIYETAGLAVYDVKVPEDICNDNFSGCPGFAHLCYHNSIKKLCPRTCGFSCDQQVATSWTNLFGFNWQPAMEVTSTHLSLTSTTTTTTSTTTTTTTTSTSPSKTTTFTSTTTTTTTTTTQPRRTTATKSTTITTSIPVISTESELDDMTSPAVTVRLPIEDFANCRDTMDSCSEMLNICDANPTLGIFKIYKPLMEACRKTCRLCDANEACASLAEFCHKPGINKTCPGTCRGLASMAWDKQEN